MYDLRRPAAFGPAELVAYERLARRVNELLPVEPQGEAAETQLVNDLEEVLRAQLRLVSPEMGALDRDALPYLAVMRALEYYNACLRADHAADEARDPKAVRAAPRTGAASLPN